MRRRNGNNSIYNLIYLKVKITTRNVFLTLTDSKGAVLVKNSTGFFGYKGSKKTTPFIVSNMLKRLLKKSFSKRIKHNSMILQYFGSENDAQFEGVLRALEDYRIRNIIYVEFLRKQAHNGVRKKKKSR